MVSLENVDGGCWVGFGGAVDLDDDENAVFAFGEGSEGCCAGGVSDSGDDGV